jgi:hypothetical protein
MNFKIKPQPILFLGFALMLNACKKDTKSTANKNEDDPAKLTKLYADLGFNFLGRLDSYKQDVSQTGNFFLKVFDVREVNGKVNVAWQSEENIAANGPATVFTYYGYFANKVFQKNEYTPCKGTDVFDNYETTDELDAQGNLFHTYRFKLASEGLWKQGQCASNGLNVPQYTGMGIENIAWEENNQLLTGVGGAYNGIETIYLKRYNYVSGVMHEEALTNMAVQPQGFDYLVTESNNAFFAYTNLPANTEFDGNINLMGNDGVSWVNLGSLATSQIRKLAGVNITNYYEPASVRLVRNGETPWVLVFKPNNTLGVFKFDGASLQLVADDVPFPSDISKYYTFAVWNNKLVCNGNANNNNQGIINAKNGIYLLDGNAFTLHNSVNDQNATITGVYSNGTKLWATCEIWSTDNKGTFFSPIDLIEVP